MKCDELDLRWVLRSPDSRNVRVVTRAAAFLRSGGWGKFVRALAASVVVLVAGNALGVDLKLLGVMGEKALIQVGDAPPVVVAAGARIHGDVRLVSINSDRVVIEFKGERRTLELGAGGMQTSAATQPTALSLYADSQGHFFADGAINGASVRFLVDTGATLVAMGVNDATRAGIDYRSGRLGTSMSAAGPVRVWRVRIASFRIGNVVLRNIESAVLEHEMPVVLLGMSAMKRFEMQNDGRVMVLRQKY